ncbi:hypothetical protein GCM10025880_28700 [Methylorubrum aminovorans]|nr:hypothetical protein GCM10025880_28700 [Methylorubrum aminovorans]
MHEGLAHEATAEGISDHGQGSRAAIGPRDVEGREDMVRGDPQVPVPLDLLDGPERDRMFDGRGLDDVERPPEPAVDLAGKAELQVVIGVALRVVEPLDLADLDRAVR